MQGDLTMALDLDLRHFQVLWPWLAEMSVLSAVLSIFMPPEKGASVNPVPLVQPWMYINVVLEHFQALVPITKDLLDVDAAVTASCSFGPEHEPRPVETNPSRQLHQLATMTRFARETLELSERLSEQVVERPGVFQLMAQVLALIV
jgi:hypothetical protein